MAMTAEPFYRWLSQQQHWQPPSENYVMKESRYPTAAQDLRNLFGNFFAQNPAQSYRVQYQPSPYQTTPSQTTYNPYSTSNVSPAQQEINQRIGDALHSYMSPQPTLYRKTNQLPQYSTYNLGTPQANYNAEAAPEARNAMYEFALKQGVPMVLTGMATGGMGYGLGAVARPYVPYVLMRLGATRYGKPIADGINKLAETPVGKFVGQIADFIW